MLFQPFFINSNIITNKSSLISYDSFLTAIAGNTGNSYITYALLKELGISELKDEFHNKNLCGYLLCCDCPMQKLCNNNISNAYDFQDMINESF